MLWSFFWFDFFYVVVENIQVMDIYGYVWCGVILGCNVCFVNWYVMYCVFGGFNIMCDYFGNWCFDIGVISGGNMMCIWVLIVGVIWQNIEWIDSYLEVVGFDNFLGMWIVQGIILICL